MRRPNEGKLTASTLGDGLLVHWRGRKEVSHSKELYGARDIKVPRSISEVKGSRNQLWQEKAFKRSINPLWKKDGVSWRTKVPFNQLIGQTKKILMKQESSLFNHKCYVFIKGMRNMRITTVSYAKGEQERKSLYAVVDRVKCRL